MKTDADPDPAYHFDADTDPNFQFNVDPYGSESTTLQQRSKKPELYTVAPM